MLLELLRKKLQLWPWEVRIQLAARLPPTKGHKSEASSSWNSQALRTPMKLRNIWEAGAQLLLLSSSDNPVLNQKHSLLLQMNFPYRFTFPMIALEFPGWLTSHLIWIRLSLANIPPGYLHFRFFFFILQCLAKGSTLIPHWHPGLGHSFLCPLTHTTNWDHGKH